MAKRCPDIRMNHEPLVPELLDEHEQPFRLAGWVVVFIAAYPIYAIAVYGRELKSVPM